MKTKKINKCLRITTTVSPEMQEDFDNWNETNPRNSIKWSECVKRGFYSLLREKEGADISQIFDDLPIVVQERIHALSNRLAEAQKQLDALRVQK